MDPARRPQLEAMLREQGVDVEAVERSQAERALDPAEHDYLPRVLPAGWVETQRGDDGGWYAWRGGLVVGVSAGRELDDRRWLHISVSRRGKGVGGLKPETKMPTYDDLKLVKRIFVGPKGKAIEIHAADKEHINFHPCVRHLFACLDENPLPDFTRGLGTI